MSVIEARSVTCRFGAFTAVDAVDLVVGPGEVVALLGANGAGKTTLIRTILGLLAPTAGSIRLFGRPPGLEQRRRIGYVPQNLGLYPDLSEAENLQFRAQVYETAHAPHGLAESAGSAQPIGTLPLGLQRRAAFTAALQHDPELLVLDEPTSGVSPLARSDLWGLIRGRAETGAAVLVSTHHMDEAVQADRLVVLAEGRVVVRGTAAEVIAERTIVEVECERWAEAFGVLDHGGRHILLSGRTIRLLSLHPDTVRDELVTAGIAAHVRLVPATLDETMVALNS